MNNKKKNVSKVERFLPSCSKLNASFRLRGKEYLRENTLHGFPYFINSRRPLWERIAWFICTMASIGGALGIMMSILTNFRTDPTLTDLDTETDELVVYFPSITLCPLNLKFNWGDRESDAEHFESMYNWSWQELKDAPKMELVDETYSSFFFRTSPACEDLYTECIHHEKPVSCGDMFQKIIGTRGVCCFIEATRIAKETKPWSLFWRTTAYPISMDVLEHNGPPVHRFSASWYYLRDGGTATVTMQQTYSTSSLDALPMWQRKCLAENDDPSYNMCINRCERKLINETCGCVPWYLSSFGDYRECARREYTCLSANSTLFTDIHEKCDCQLACNHTVYHLRHIEYKSGNASGIMMISWPTLVYKRDVSAGWLDLAVSFGGIAGLFVGYSLLTTVELGYYFTLRSYCGAVLTESEKIIKIKVSEAQVKQRVIKTIDLKNDYWDYVN